MHHIPQTVAVIDDVPDNTEVVSLLLTAICEVPDVRVFHSGEEFLAGWLNSGFGMILLDLFMPGMSGYEVCNAIRRLDANVPIIAFSAYPDERTRALNWGFTDFIAKPITDSDSLCVLVHRYLDQRRAS